MNKIKNGFDVLYIAMAITVIGQCIVGNNVLIGQGLFLVSNITYLCRDFYLHRPIADKIKNTLFTAITIGIILFNLIK